MSFGGMAVLKNRRFVHILSHVYHNPQICCPLNGLKVYKSNGRRICDPFLGAFASACDFSTATPETAPYFKTPGSQLVFADLLKLDQMAPKDVRVLVEDAIITKVDDVVLWSHVATYCINRASEFKFFDALSILHSFAKMNIYDATLMDQFSRVLMSNVYKMEPRHFVTAIDAFATFGKFPESLFTEIFCGIMSMSNRMYSQEFVDLFLCLARWDITNPRLLQNLCKSLSENISFLRYPQLLQIMWAARKLDVADETFYLILDTWQKKELAMMSFQELFDACKAARTLAYTWPPYSEALFQEFVKQSKQLEDVGVLADPFDCLYFLKLIDQLSSEFLQSLCKWCADAVHRPPHRSEKRPQSHELVQLHDIVKEYNIDETYLDKAILKFVTSKGGLRLRTPRPISTRYKANRQYIRAQDPLNFKNEPEPKFLEEGQEPPTVESKAAAEASNDLIKEMEPYPKFIDGFRHKKPSTQSCGKVSFKSKAKTKRHKNTVAVDLS